MGTIVPTNGYPRRPRKATSLRWPDGTDPDLRPGPGPRPGDAGVLGARLRQRLDRPAGRGDRAPAVRPLPGVRLEGRPVPRGPGAVLLAPRRHRRPEGPAAGPARALVRPG